MVRLFGLTGSTINNIVPIIIIVHQRPDRAANILSEHQVLNLPEDWLIANSPSGYISKDAFRRFLNRRFMWVDAYYYYSHLCGEEIKMLKDDLIFVLFVLANDSENSQAGDCGPNACIRNLNDKELSAERQRRPGI